MALRPVNIIAIALLLACACTVTHALAEDKPVAAETKRHSYVGSKACKMCHMGEAKGRVWEIWLDSKHAKAFASLDSAKGERNDPKCLKCHTTGYEDGGYGAKGMEAVDLANVGCEACHGPGSDYKAMSIMKDREKALAAGLQLGDAKSCLRCHNEESPTFKKPFVFEEEWKKIAHKVPPKAEGGK